MIDKNVPWYWICHGPSKNLIAFNCTEATRSKVIALVIIAKRNYLEYDGVWFIRESFEHPDPDRKQFKCPECFHLISKNELDRTWDWAGPHCNNCECTGMTMFGAVQDHAPVVSGRNKQ